MEAFALLADIFRELPDDQPKVIVLDEFLWMANYRADVVGDLKMVWDAYLRFYFAFVHKRRAEIRDGDPEVIYANIRNAGAWHTWAAPPSRQSASSTAKSHPTPRLPRHPLPLRPVL